MAATHPLAELGASCRMQDFFFFSRALHSVCCQICPKVSPSHAGFPEMPVLPASTGRLRCPRPQHRWGANTSLPSRVWALWEQHQGTVLANGAEPLKSFGSKARRALLLTQGSKVPVVSPFSSPHLLGTATSRHLVLDPMQDSTGLCVAVSQKVTEQPEESAGWGQTGFQPRARSSSQESWLNRSAWP